MANRKRKQSATRRTVGFRVSVYTHTGAARPIHVRDFHGEGAEDAAGVCFYEEQGDREAPKAHVKIDRLMEDV